VFKNFYERYKGEHFNDAIKRKMVDMIVFTILSSLIAKVWWEWAHGRKRWRRSHINALCFFLSEINGIWKHMTKKIEEGV